MIIRDCTLKVFGGGFKATFDGLRLYQLSVCGIFYHPILQKIPPGPIHYIRSFYGNEAWKVLLNQL